MEDNYIPVNCDFYDELESLATMKRKCDILFTNNGGRTQVRAIIADLYSREKVEYLKTDSGLEIRLDQIIQVDGKIPSNYC